MGVERQIVLIFFFLYIYILLGLWEERRQKLCVEYCLIYENPVDEQSAHCNHPTFPDPNLLHPTHPVATPIPCPPSWAGPHINNPLSTSKAIGYDLR